MDQLTTIYNAGATIYSGLKAGMSYYQGDKNIKYDHAHAEIIGFVVALALAALFPEGIKPRDMKGCYMGYDQNDYDRTVLNNDTTNNIYASHNLINRWPELVEAALFVLAPPPPPQQLVQSTPSARKSGEHDSLNTTSSQNPKPEIKNNSAPTNPSLAEDDKDKSTDPQPQISTQADANANDAATQNDQNKLNNAPSGVSEKIEPKENDQEKSLPNNNSNNAAASSEVNAKDKPSESDLPIRNASPQEWTKREKAIRTLWEFAIKGLHKIKRSYVKNPDYRPTVTILDTCIRSIQNALDGHLSAFTANSEVTEKEMDVSRKIWQSDEKLIVIAEALETGEAACQGGARAIDSNAAADFSLAEPQRAVIASLTRWQAQTYHKDMGFK